MRKVAARDARGRVIHGAGASRDGRTLVPTLSEQPRDDHARDAVVIHEQDVHVRGGGARHRVRTLRDVTRCLGKQPPTLARASSSHAPSSSPPPRASHASAPRRMPFPCAPSESPLRTHACSCGPPRPRTFGVCRALVVSARTHKTAEVSPGPFCHSEQTTWHGQLLGLRFPVSRLCAVVVSVLLE